MYTKILIAYDGSAAGRAALLEWTNALPAPHQEVHLLAVMGMPSGVFLSEGFIPETLLEEEKRRFQDVLDEGVKLLADRGFHAQGHLVFGEPVDEISRVARELGSELIVVGHRKQASFASRWWRGSLGSTLLEKAPCSLLYVLSDV